VTAPAAVAGAGTLLALDAAYRAALAKTSMSVIRILLASWSTVSVNDLAGTSDRFLNDSVTAIFAGQRNAVQQANAYTSYVRQISAPRAPSFSPPPAAPPNEEQIRKSMEFTAFHNAAKKLVVAQRVAEGDKAARPVDPSGFEDPGDGERAAQVFEGMKKKIMREAVTAASAAAVRHVTTAGMDQLKANVVADKVAIGWYRTTKAGCCYFCAMLASRGLVYKEDSFKASNAQFAGPGEQKVHDSCGCGLRPVYSKFDELPDQTEEFSKLWADTATGSGAEAIRNFRRAYESRSIVKA